MIQPSFSDTAQQLDERYKTTGSLTRVLAELYHLQCQAGFIPDNAKHLVAELLPVKTDFMTIFVQFNPHRRLRGIAPAANPNPVNIIPWHNGIPCFCCLENIQQQWPEERGFYFNDYGVPLVFLPNPAPIFPQHFTVAHTAHIPNDMALDLVLKLAWKLPDYWVIQNGAQTGATNPWHFHLQVFQSELPLSDVTARSQQRLEKDRMAITLSELAFPMTIFRMDCPQLTNGLLNWLMEIQTQFLTADSNFRLNYLAKRTRHGISVYLALRTLLNRTDLYAAAQPGYAEIGGIIPAFTPEEVTRWSTQGTTLFPQLMRDIGVDADTRELFYSILMEE